MGRLDFIVDFPVEPSFLLDRNPRWRSHLLSRIEADPPVGFAWCAWSSCYYSGASLGILGVPHLLIVVCCDCGWKNLSRVCGLHLCKLIPNSPVATVGAWLINRVILSAGINLIFYWSPILFLSLISGHCCSLGSCYLNAAVTAERIW